MTMDAADIVPLEEILMATAILGENHFDVPVALGPVGTENVFASSMNL